MSEEQKKELQDILNEQREKQESIQKKQNDITTDEVIKEIHKSAVISVVTNDEETKKEILERAKQTVKNEVEAIEQDTINKKQKSTYDANAEACKNYGIDKSVPIWQVKMMRIGSAVWFVIYFVIASVTIAPINVFFKGIKSFIKSTWLAIIFAVVIYLTITVGIPLVVNFTK